MPVNVINFNIDKFLLVRGPSVSQIHHKTRPIVNSAYQRVNFLISQLKKNVFKFI